MAPNDPSDKSRGVATALALVLGLVGAHRFYVGKAGSGILMAVTGGGLGVWWLYDVITVALGDFRDVDGRRVALWDPSEAEPHRGELPSQVLDELDTMRRELAELHERMDFTERLLAQASAGTPRLIRNESTRD